MRKLKYKNEYEDEHCNPYKIIPSIPLEDMYAI